ncbi:M28 family peptidase [bacterium]|nr:M28 family peptidase [bacterium]
MKSLMKKSIFILTSIILINCQTDETQFNGNSAFNWLEQQCEFGPRNPGSNGYYQCQDFLIYNLKEFSDTVFTQSFTYTELRNNNTYDLNNIVAQFNINSGKHLLLGAHWDTRPWADRDLDISNRSTPIIGANDGASGVAILMELAKMFNTNSPPINVTLVLFDGEDMGVEGVNNSWAKGSQYFAENLPIQKPDFGIIVDMIGDSNLEIPIERYSYRVAPDLVNELWDLAEKLKLPAFQNRLGYDMYDDHIPLWEIAGIPAIDLIDFNYPNQRINYWHTLNDIPQNCSAESLEQVGQLLSNYIYSLTP